MNRGKYIPGEPWAGMIEARQKGTASLGKTLEIVAKDRKQRTNSWAGTSLVVQLLRL